MQRILIFILFITYSSLYSFGSLRDLPIFQVPDCLGVNIHFSEPREHDLSLIAAAGFRTIRMDLVWAAVEREKGQYDFASYKALTEAMRARDMTPLYILDYSNKLYEENRSVKTEAGREAFARFAAQAVKELGKGILWEIWNEPNLKQFGRISRVLMIT